MTVEQFTRDWYERLKQEDQYHFEDVWEGETHTLEYTYEKFKNSPMVQTAIQVLDLHLAWSAE